jgi:UDP-N-acetylmuramoyl-tripeptide--D-alanyl-D-alanine ligase
MIKKIVQKKIATLAQNIINSHNPEIIAITGSVGKTTTKEAIATVVSSRFSTRASFKNYNNELGVPLTIIGSKSPKRSVTGWLEVFRQAKKIIQNSKGEYPEMLVLEMGIDHPGDMDYLTSIVSPSRVVITRLGSAHAEFFPSVNELHQEKLKLISALQDQGTLIYNYEDEILRTHCQDFSGKTLSYGVDEKADVRGTNIALSINTESTQVGMSFKLECEGSVVPVFVPGLFGTPSLLAALAGAAVGFSYGFNGIEVADALARFKLPAGRMNLLPGFNNQIIIDDSYNSSPEACLESIKAVLEIPKDQYHQSWVVLGDMRELGKDSKAAHKNIGIFCAEKKIDYLVTVGGEAKNISEAAMKSGMNEKNVWQFGSSIEAAEFLKTKVQTKDLVLVKGSQAVRMEKIVKHLMKFPEQAKELLVRQEPEWQ